MNFSWQLLLLLLPLAGQIYVSLRVWQLLPDLLLLRLAAVVLMTLAFATFFVAMSGALDRMPIGPATLAYEVGTSWVILLLYLILLFVVIDLALVLHFLPRAWVKGSVMGSVAVGALLVGVFTYAYLHFEHKQRVELTLDSGGRVSRPLKLVMMSDLHLGYHNRRSDLHRWLELIKAERPDAILIAGDLIDQTLKPVLEEESAEEFRRLGIPVFAILGNHDYYGRHGGRQGVLPTGRHHDVARQRGLLGRCDHRGARRPHQPPAPLAPRGDGGHRPQQVHHRDGPSALPP